MTLSATPSACALGGGASAKASAGRARHTHPSQPQNPFSLLRCTMTSIFCSLRQCASYGSSFPLFESAGLASAEHAASAVGFETLARASLTRSYPCLYWAVPRAPGEALPAASTVNCFSALASSRGSVLAQN